MFLPEGINSWPTTSIIYSIPYLILGLLTIWCMLVWDSKGFSSKNKVIYNVIFLIFLLFFGFRWHIMTDTIAYNMWYEAMSPSWKSLSDYSGLSEPGFLAFLVGIKIIGLDFTLFVFLNSLIDFILLYSCVKKYSINIPLTILLFLAFNGITYEINLMRNIKAILIFVYSIQFIKNKNLFKFLLCQTVGALFHISAILFIPMYWICRIRFKTPILYLLSFISVIVYLFFPSIIESFINGLISVNLEDMEKLSRYATQAEGGKLSLGTLERLFSVFLLLMTYKRIKDENYVIFANCFLAFFVLYSFFGFNSIFRDRIPYLFVFSYWFVYPYYIREYATKIRSFKSVLVLFCFMRIIQATNYCAAYYENVFFHTTTIEQRDYLNDKVGSRE